MSCSRSPRLRSFINNDRIVWCEESSKQDVVIIFFQTECSTCGSTGLRRSRWRKSLYCRRSFNSNHMSTSTFTSLWHLLFLSPFLHRVCVGVHTDTDAEWNSVDYSDWLRKTMRSRRRWGCENTSNGSGLEKQAPCLHLHGNQTKTGPARKGFLHTCKRHHWFCLTICPHTFVSKTEENLGSNPISRTPSRRLVFWSIRGTGRTHIKNFDLKMYRRQRRN